MPISAIAILWSRSVIAFYVLGWIICIGLKLFDVSIPWPRINTIHLINLGFGLLLSTLLICLGAIWAKVTKPLLRWIYKKRYPY